MSAAATLLVLLCTMGHSTGHAFEMLRFDLGRMTRNGWTAEGVSLGLGLREADQWSFRLAADSVHRSGWPQPIEQVGLDCPHVVLASGAVSCEDASLRFTLGKEQFRASGAHLALAREGDLHRLQLRRLSVAAGVVDLDASIGPDDWHIKVLAQDLDLGRVFELASASAPLPALAISEGRGTVEVRLSGAAAARRVVADLRMHDLGFSNESGLHAGEELDVNVMVSMDATPDGWRVSGDAAAKEGRLYIDPVYAEVSEAPFTAEWVARWRPDSQRLLVDRFYVVHPGVARLEGAARIAAERLERLTLTLAPTAFGPLYTTYLQPFAAGTPLDRLRTEGEVELRLGWGATRGAEAALVVRDVSLEDEGRRFGLSGVSGTLRWAERADGGASDVRWGAGHLYRVELGPGELLGRFQGRGFALERPLVQPVFDGALRLDRLEAENVGGADVTWTLSGQLAPVSLERVTAALEWPALAGSISGEIPAVRYARGVMHVEAPLLVRVFGGTIALRDLRMRRPFGIAPVLHADVDVRGISLDALTRTFSFGNIQGGLDGTIRDLVLEDWRPRAFDARFATPKNDPSPHRISQRAIQNLTRLGGAQAAMSRTFMRLFNEFSYQRLGLSCRLANGVCEMGGVKNAEQGYYIVEGGGIPRIDVIGYNRRVDWDTLVERLERVTRVEPP
ncbi:MAG: hypothetical protein GWN84_15965 [Gammaproteobacteria bacterium]|nr:hypothetical protein [Gammaproteobacteria bacterium]NIR84280.1 hypothetical protein [Gammaproteobacteria bacterium]NIR89750.1 hypothetical protein [Gammaproteobacteria bacterium]NIU05438.1 hypothetical protein [Gammaproteobacteria bacterium]NIV52384.1 hypothetical protein [Gammaproteobacteria bacterium]